MYTYLKTTDWVAYSADEPGRDVKILNLPWKPRKQASEAPAGPAPEMRTSTSITGKPVLVLISGIVIIRIVFADDTCLTRRPYAACPVLSYFRYDILMKN